MCVRRIIVAMVALGAAAALVAPAAGRGVGTPVQVRDRDDTAGPLDIATASVRLRERPGRGRMLVLRLGTHEQWDAEALAEQGGSAASFIAFEFDGDRRQPADRCVEVTLGAAGELAARMKAPCTPIHARPVGDSLSVRRRGPRAIELAVPLGSLRQSALRRGWRATSSFEALGPECAPFANAAPEGRFGACADITRWAGLDRAARRTRRRRACTTKGAKTIKATRHARAFKTGARVYGCLYSAGRRFLLANPAYGVDQVRNVRLAGRFVGYSRQAQGQRQVTVRELRRGRIVHNATAAVAPRCCFTSVTDLELKRNGSVAWIAETIPSDLPLAPPGSYPGPRPDYQVQKADRAGQALLDAAQDIAARSLTRRGATIAWMRGGAVSSAVLD